MSQRANTLLLVITVILAVTMACAFSLLFLAEAFGAGSAAPGLEGGLVGIVLILSAAIPVYAVFRPLSGGIALCFLAAGFAFTFNAFHISRVLFPSRAVGYHPFFSVVTMLILVLGGLSVVRARSNEAKMAG